MPLVLQTSGGTTGLPRPMLYAPAGSRDDGDPRRRAASRMQGMRPGDMVLVAFSLGLSNGGMATARSLWQLHGRGAGDDRQRRHHADAAADRDLQGLGHQRRARLPLVPAAHGAGRARRDGHRRARPQGPHARHASRHGGSQADRGAVGRAALRFLRHARERHDRAECKHQTGMHIQEDAFVLEIVDPDTGKVLPDGERGTTYITTLYRTARRRSASTSTTSPLT